MKFAKKRIFLLILTVLFLLPVLISCKDNSNDNSNTDVNQNSQSDEKSDNGETPSDSATTGEYEYPDFDGGGSDFTIFSFTTAWGMYTDIVRNEITGEVLDDAIYKRNRQIEDKFNINLKELNEPIEGDIANHLQKIIFSGEDLYDAAFVPITHSGGVAPLILEDMLYNLKDITSLNLDGEWWNQTMKKEAELGSQKKLFYLACDINIMTLQSSACIYFNEDMMANLGLDLPYNLVKEGKWTFDAMQQYMREGAQLNGAETFKWKNSSTAIYGFTAAWNAANALFDGSGERSVRKDEDGMPYLALHRERVFNVLQKIKDMLLVDDGSYLYADTFGGPRWCETLFRDGRAMMLTATLQASDNFRDMDATFGILPIPKFDEYQENHYSNFDVTTPLLVVPVTNTREEFTGAVLDAMAYVSNREVTPIFFDVTMSQKRLRNDESIEMLQIIRDSTCFDVGAIYNWTTDFFYGIRFSLSASRAFDLASHLDRYGDIMAGNIERAMEFFE